jgi:hypothetical protein
MVVAERRADCLPQIAHPQGCNPQNLHFMDHTCWGFWATLKRRLAPLASSGSGRGQARSWSR